MTNLQKIGLILLIMATFMFIKTAFFSNQQQEAVIEETTIEETMPIPEESNENTLKSYVNVYFIGQNSNKEEVYKIVRRDYNPQTDGTKIKASIEKLLEGPSSKEKNLGIYSEIPKGTRLLSLEETPNKVTINLSGEFEQGGGTDGLYKRLYQLIKTANKNTALDIYLNLNGRQADVIGGEGIMVNQPLTNRSLDE